MSKLFFDRFIVFEEIEIELKKLDMSSEEKQEFNEIIEELLHHRIIDRVLTHLPRDHHEEFLTKFHKAPHDETLINYINERISEACRAQNRAIEESIEHHIHDEVQKLKKEILGDIHSSSN